MNSTDDTPLFTIHRMYVKDMALEQPNAPHILTETAAPKIEVELGFSAEGIREGYFEVCVVATVLTTIEGKTLFRIVAKQAGIFEIRNLPDEQVEAVIGISCPQMIFPFLRSTVSDVCTRGGFPPVLLAEVDFRAMFESRKGDAAQTDAQALAA